MSFTIFHQRKKHFLAAADAGVQETVKVGGINSQFPPEKIVISTAVFFHKLKHSFIVYSSFHSTYPSENNYHNQLNL